MLSLDAPAVALAWQGLLGRVAGVTLTGAEAFVLGASVWLAYAADRWIEGWRLDPAQTRTARHRFYQYYRWPTAFAWVAIFALDVIVAFRALPVRALTAGFLLLAPVLAYLLSHQLIHREHRWRLPKELCVAGLLAGGVALFPAAHESAALRALAPPLGLFALLCFANCALISAWEHEVDVAHEQTSLARQFRQGAAMSRSLPWMLAFVGILVALAESGDARVAASCATASAVLLRVVDWAEPRLGWRAARVLADAALLTPVFPLLSRSLGS